MELNVMIKYVIRFLISLFRTSRLQRNTYRVTMKKCIKKLVVSYVVNGGDRDRDVSPDEIFELASIIFSKPKGYEWSLEDIHDTLSYVTYPNMYSENSIDIFVTIVDHASQTHDKSP